MTESERRRKLVIFVICLVIFLALLAWNPAHGQARRTGRVTRYPVATERVSRYPMPTPWMTPQPTATQRAMQRIPLATVTPGGEGRIGR